MDEMDRDIRIIYDDILLGMDRKTRTFAEPTVVLHGCNCFHTMGAGIAYYLRKIFPEIYETDKRTNYGDPKKLGQTSIAHINDTLAVVNCYTQFHFNGAGVLADYNAIHKALRATYGHFNTRHFRLPKIGCGLAGGDWVKVKDIYLDTLRDANFTVYEK